MYFAKVAALITLINTLVVATSSDNVNLYKRFYLRTHLLPHQTIPEYDGLWLLPYHTAAGFNVGTFSKTASKRPPKYALKGYLNNTVLIFPIGESNYELSLPGPYGDDYAGWFNVAVDIGVDFKKPSPTAVGFSINADGYLVNSGQVVSFIGWRVCLWNHGVPELFHEYRDAPSEVPKNCVLTHLRPVYEDELEDED